MCPVFASLSATMSLIRGGVSASASDFVSPGASVSHRISTGESSHTDGQDRSATSQSYSSPDTLALDQVQYPKVVRIRKRSHDKGPLTGNTADECRISKFFLLSVESELNSCRGPAAMDCGEVGSVCGFPGEKLGADKLPWTGNGTWPNAPELRTPFPLPILPLGYSIWLTTGWLMVSFTATIRPSRPSCVRSNFYGYA